MLPITCAEYRNTLLRDSTIVARRFVPLQFGHFLVRVPKRPTGEQKTAQGFSPGNDTPKESALQGRPNGADDNV